MAHPNAGFFRKLVSLREEDRFASQDLALLADRDPTIARRIRDPERQVPSPRAQFGARRLSTGAGSVGTSVSVLPTL